MDLQHAQTTTDIDFDYKKGTFSIKVSGLDSVCCSGHAKMIAFIGVFDQFKELVRDQLKVKKPLDDFKLDDLMETLRLQASYETKTHKEEYTSNGKDISNSINPSDL